MAVDVLTMEDAAGSSSFFSSAAVAVTATMALVVSEMATDVAAIPSCGS